MQRKELILMLLDEHNEKTIKLLRDFPYLLRDLYVLNAYDEAYRINKAKKIRACKQRSRDEVIERFGIGVNHFYEIKKRVDWLLQKM